MHRAASLLGAVGVVVVAPMVPVAADVMEAEGVAELVDQDVEVAARRGEDHRPALEAAVRAGADAGHVGCPRPEHPRPRGRPGRETVAVQVEHEIVVGGGCAVALRPDAERLGCRIPTEVLVHQNSTKGTDAIGIPSDHRGDDCLVDENGAVCGVGRGAIGDLDVVARCVGDYWRARLVLPRDPIPVIENGPVGV